MSLITVESLTKEFRQAIKKPGLAGSIKHLFMQKYITKTAVDRIDFTIDKGESVAYLGPNGAGKSTTVKMLTGILVPTSGHVMVDGLIPYRQRIEHVKKIGVVFGQRTQLWWDIPVIESLALLKDIYEIPEKTYRRNIKLFTDMLDLEDFVHLPARKISLGQRMRADLAAALLHEPAIVFLDEPTIGLDIAVKARIRDFIKKINREAGITIMLTTHDLDDIEDICRRLIIIDQGKIIYDGGLQAVKDVFAQEKAIHFEVREPIQSLDQIVGSLPGVILESGRSIKGSDKMIGADSTCSADERHFIIRLNRFKITAGEVISHMMKYGEVLDIRIDEPEIEQVIRQVYEGKLDLSVIGRKKP